MRTLMVQAAVETAGAAAVALGLWWIYPPAALIALGAAAISLSVWRTARGGGRRT